MVEFDPNSKAIRGKDGVLKAQLSTPDYDIKKIKVYKDNKVLNIAKVSDLKATFNFIRLIADT